MSLEAKEAQKNRRKSMLKLSVYEGRRRVNHLLFGNIQKKRAMKIKTKEQMFVWTVLAPSIIAFLIFWLYVNVDSILMAFQDVDFEAGGKVVWTLNNYKTIYEMLVKGKYGVDLGLFLKNTMLYFVLGLFTGIFQSFFMTYAFQKKLAGHKFFRIAMFIPSIIGGVVWAAVFESFISTRGVAGYVMSEFMGLRVPSWFQEDAWATPMLLFFSWFTGIAGNYIIFSGAMGKISREITEAAYMDGVTMWQEIWYIVIPQMWPTLSMTILTTFTGIFGASGNILLFTPHMTSTFTFSHFIFDQVRTYNSYYLASSLGFIMTVFTLPICLIVRKIVDNIYVDSEW